MAPKGGITLGEKFFPQGTVLSVNPYVFMTSKEIWGPDAAEFNPGRWLGEDAKRLDKYFCAWGGGWAACPGQDIARIQMSKLGVSKSPKLPSFWKRCARLLGSADTDVAQGYPDQRLRREPGGPPREMEMDGILHHCPERMAGSCNEKKSPMRMGIVSFAGVVDKYFGSQTSSRGKQQRRRNGTSVVITAMPVQSWLRWASHTLKIQTLGEVFNVRVGVQRLDTHWLRSS